MRKIYISMLASLAILAGCAKQAAPQAPEIPDEDAWIDDESLPVPVQFSAPDIAVESKAVITGEIEGTVLNNLDIGIFGVQPEMEGFPAWSEDDGKTILMKNRKITTTEDGRIDFGDDKVYYPAVNDNIYAFFGYYPYNDNLVYEDNRYLVEYELGDTDILWAGRRAPHTERFTGYNAAYVRYAAKNYPSFLPKLEFEHLLTSLHFAAKTEKGEEAAENIKVTGLEILEVPVSARLCIVDEKAAATDEDFETRKSGTFIPDETKPVGSIALKVDGNVELDVAPVEAGAEIGYVMLLPAESYKLRIELTVTGQEPVAIEKTITRDGGFLKGKRYSMNVIVKSPVEVDITTSLTDWQDITGGDIMTD